MNMSLKVYIATHKQYPKVSKYIDENYEFIQVGAHNKERIPGYLSDHAADLISEKNDTYSELTALYYIWKKDKNDYVGLVHYRRLFSPKSINIFKYHGLKGDKIKKYLEKYDIILPKRPKMRVTVKENYERNHYIQDLFYAREVIEHKYQDYIKAFDEVMKSKRQYLFNMFIMKKELLNQYAEFLFTILFEVEKHVDISSYDQYQRRIFGFISERLFNVWVLKENLKVKELNIIEIERNPFVETIKAIPKKIVGIKGDVKR